MAGRIFVPDEARFKIKGPLAHIHFTSGGDEWHFTTPLVEFRGTLRRANRIMSEHDAAKGDVVPIRRKSGE